MYNDKVIDKSTYELSLQESLPQKPFDVPQIAPHLVQKVAKEHPAEKIKTTIQLDLQERTTKS